MAIYSAPRPAGYRADPTTGLLLDARSPWLLQGDTPPAQPGEQQPFPNTAVDLIAALGATGVILPAQVIAIYLANTASPLVDALGLGPNLVASAAGAATGRECVGLPTTSFNAKVGVEITNVGDAFADAGVVFGDANASTVAFLIVSRVSPAQTVNGAIISKMTGGATGWILLQQAANIRIFGNGGASLSSIASVADGAWHCYAGVVDDVARTGQLFSDIADGAAGGYAGSAANAASFQLGFGNWQLGALAQIAYVAILNVALTSAMRASFWRAFNLNEFSTPCAYVRANPLVTRITSTFGNVACYGANQPAVGYAANASTATNPLKTGVVCEDGASFLGLGTDNMPAFVGTNATVTAATGPSGMQDACRVADTDGVNAGYATSGAAVLAGATNVPFVYSAYVKSGGVGTNAVYQSYYTGDGGGPETFTNWTIVGAVSAVWRPFIGLAHTPVGAAHTAVVTYLIPTDNVGASLGTVDFAEVWGVQNSNVDRLTWRRAATGAASATGTPSLSMTNVGNARYSPSRERVVVRLSGFVKQEERNIGNYATGAGTYGCCTDGANVWVTNITDHTVTKRKISDGSLVGTYAAGTDPGTLCYDSANNYIWICNRDDRTVTVLNAATGANVATYNAGAAGSNSRGICYDGANVWVGNLNNDAVTKVRCSDGTTLGTYATAVAPHHCCYANGSVWVSCYTGDVIRKLTAATGAFVGDYAVTRPVQACYDGTNIWVPSETGNNIRKLTEATGAFVADYATGTTPFGSAFDGTNIWVSNVASRTVVKLLATTGAMVSRYAGLGVDPIGVAWDGNNLWVAINGASVVTKIGTQQNFLCFGVADAAGALVLDYAGDVQYAPLMGTTPQLRLRLWDDLAALVCDLDCGTLTTTEAIRTIEWNAATGCVNVLNGAVVLATKNPPAPWVPEPNDVTPLYVGSDATPANAAHCLITLIEGFNY